VPGFEDAIVQFFLGNLIEPRDFPEVALDAARQLADLCAIDNAMIEGSG
jgi:hypothetical protein